MDLLEPVTRSLVEQVIQEAATLGISLLVFETYRSQDRQQELFQEGKSLLQTVGVHH
jgi:LAS superfamily LD-carboxypeptidase LdcB